MGPVRLAIDCMGGDHGLPVTVPAGVSFALSEPLVRLILVGRGDEIRAALAACPDYVRVKDRVDILHAQDVVEMDDPVTVAMRGKKDSSMRVAIEAVKAGQADAVVSAGNTGALMAIARYVLKTLDGIDRPAIAQPIPNRAGGVTTCLDLGANVDCQAEHLLQFAVMGSAFVSAVFNKESPSVGLLNVGEEVIKGNEVVKKAGELLRHSGLNFYGNVEGDDIYKDTVDVVVCDGFVGNLVLKASEGLAQMVQSFMREEFTRNPLTWLIAFLSMPVLRRFRRRLDHRRYNGAALLGLRGVVIKSHGSADAYGFEFALRRGFDAANHHLLEKTVKAMAPLLSGLSASSPAPASGPSEACASV